MSSRKIADYYKAAKAIVLRTVGEIVPKDVAIARLRICQKCPETRFPLTIEESLAAKVAGGELVCGVCGCGIELLVVTKPEHLPQDEPDVVRPEKCWHPHPK